MRPIVRHWSNAASGGFSMSRANGGLHGGAAELAGPRAPTRERLVADAAFSPSGTLIRLRRGNKNAQLLAALMCSCEPFHLDEAAAGDVQLLESIRRGQLEVF
jgi:hypothetical protein